MTQRGSYNSALTQNVQPSVEENQFDNLNFEIKLELEHLNISACEINRLENELSVIRASYNDCLNKYKNELVSLSKELGSCVQRTRPYYDALRAAEETFQQTIHASDEYRLISDACDAIKDTWYATEKTLSDENCDLNSNNETVTYLNRISLKITEIESQRALIEKYHKDKSYEYNIAEERVHSFRKISQAAVRKAKPYYDLRRKFNNELKEKKQYFNTVQSELGYNKKIYSQALKRLEDLSETIRAKQAFFEIPQLIENSENMSVMSDTLDSDDGNSNCCERKNENDHCEHNSLESYESPSLSQSTSLQNICKKTLTFNGGVATSDNAAIRTKSF